MESQSGRPPTRRFDSDPLSEDKNGKKPGSAADKFVPRLFDLIYAASQAKDSTKFHVPPMYLEAASADSSKLLGRGASFTASLRRLPKGPEFETMTTKMPWGSVTKQIKARKRPACVVYKTARVKFDEDGEPSAGYAPSLQSVLTELHALTYPPLLQHANIINFLGLAWGTSEFDAQQAVPRLIVEYADQGTLADVLSSKQVSSELKHAFSLDTAEALQAIHEANLVHGDIKAENVLVCTGEHRMLAKLGDFGYSIVQEAESSEMLMGGTWPWTAPEVAKPLPVQDLKSTDLYSLGLLIWVIAIDGYNPFELIIPLHETNSSDDLFRAIDHLKQSDRVLASSDVRFWFPVFLFRKLSKQQSDIESIVDRRLLELLATMREYNNKPEEAKAALVKWCSDKVEQDVLLSKLNAVFLNCLGQDPQTRDLSAVLNTLSNGLAVSSIKVSDQDEPPVYHVTNSSDGPRTIALVSSAKRIVKDGSISESIASTVPASQARLMGNAEPKTEQDQTHEILSWTRRGHKHHYLSWQATRDLSPGLQTQVFHAANHHLLPHEFVQAAYHMNGYGTVVDNEAGLAAVRRSAVGGWRPAQAYLYRLHTACASNALDSDALVEYLDPMARIGSRAAMDDLTDANLSDKAEGARRWIGNRTGGVGARWYNNDQMLHGLTLGSWLDPQFTVAQAQGVEDINEYRVNERGDTLLHMLFACGEYKSAKAIVNGLKPDINGLNHAGDTALLASSRAGNGASLIVLLQQYKADASIAANNGETALHWLIRFDDADIEPIVKDMIARGARVNAITTERISHSLFPGTIDCDFQMPGTPLGWAVHHDRPHIVRTLLRYGADALFNEQKNWITPLQWAAYYHHTECLRIMIDHLEKHHASREDEKRAKGETVTSDARHAVEYHPLLYKAVHSADRFSMMLRHGRKYLQKLHATLDLLREKTVLISFGKNFGGPDRSIFYCAVAEAHDEVVEYFIKNSWHIDEINDKCGAEQRTPFLEAVRWNRRPLIELLVQNGANVNANAANPYQPDTHNWSPLHVFAHERWHAKTDLSLVNYLVSNLGVPVDGPPGTHSVEQIVSPHMALAGSLADMTLASSGVAEMSGDHFPTETPFSCALRNNSFCLCSELLSVGSNPNARSFVSGLYRSAMPLTILGHLITANARYSEARLDYLLTRMKGDIEGARWFSTVVNFIVEPCQCLTALHRAAMGPADIHSTDDNCSVCGEDFDWTTNVEILRILLRYFDKPEHLNARTSEVAGRNTALHLAVQYDNVGAVRELVLAGADFTLVNAAGITPLQLCEGDNVDGVTKRDICGILSQSVRIH